MSKRGPSGKLSPLPPDTEDFFIDLNRLKDRKEADEKFSKAEEAKLQLYSDLCKGMEEGRLRYRDLTGLTDDEVQGVSFMQQAIADIAYEVDGRGSSERVRNVIRHQLSRLGLTSPEGSETGGRPKHLHRSS